MPKTAIHHFRQDMARARGLLDHARHAVVAPIANLRDDLLRGSWMFAVGAMDAYFCDAYVDLIAATLSSKSRQPAIRLPQFVERIEIAVHFYFAEYDKSNWRWRSAARKLMDRETVLSLETVQKLFNPFCGDGNRFFSGVLDRWIPHPDARHRMFGIIPSRYPSMTASLKATARKDGLKVMESRFRGVFQRRNDCIHNCDRPRTNLQPMRSASRVEKVLQDATFLVSRFDEHIEAEFRKFLAGLGCNTSTMSQAGYAVP